MDFLRGKGVYVQGIDFDNTFDSISKLELQDEKDIIIVEDKLIGEEFSLMSIIDYN